jgi:hypothetical protein
MNPQTGEITKWTNELAQDVAGNSVQGAYKLKYNSKTFSYEVVGINVDTQIISDKAYSNLQHTMDTFNARYTAKYNKIPSDLNNVDIPKSQTKIPTPTPSSDIQKFPKDEYLSATGPPQKKLIEKLKPGDYLIGKGELGDVPYRIVRNNGKRLDYSLDGIDGVVSLDISRIDELKPSRIEFDLVNRKNADIDALKGLISDIEKNSPAPKVKPPAIEDSPVYTPPSLSDTHLEVKPNPFADPSIIQDSNKIKASIETPHSVKNGAVFITEDGTTLIAKVGVNGQLVLYTTIKADGTVTMVARGTLDHKIVMFDPTPSTLDLEKNVLKMREKGEGSMISQLANSKIGAGDLQIQKVYVNPNNGEIFSFSNSNILEANKGSAVEVQLKVKIDKTTGKYNIVGIENTNNKLSDTAMANLKAATDRYNARYGFINSPSLPEAKVDFKGNHIYTDPASIQMELPTLKRWDEVVINGKTYTVDVPNGDKIMLNYVGGDGKIHQTLLTDLSGEISQVRKTQISKRIDNLQQGDVIITLEGKKKQIIQNGPTEIGYMDGTNFKKINPREENQNQISKIITKGSGNIIDDNAAQIEREMKAIMIDWASVRNMKIDREFYFIADPKTGQIWEYGASIDMKTKDILEKAGGKLGSFTLEIATDKDFHRTITQVSADVQAFENADVRRDIGNALNNYLVKYNTVTN